MPGAAQLGQMPSAYLGGYIPKGPRQPHLWQQALAQFLGSAANEAGSQALHSVMAPKSSIGPDGKVVIAPDQHWWQSMTPDQRLQVAMGNANIGEAGARTGNIGQQTVSQKALLPGEVGQQAAQTGLTQAQAGLTGAESGQVAPNAASQRALQGAQTGLVGAQATGTPGLMSAQASGERGRGDYFQKMADWVPQETQARIGQTQAETGLVNQQTQSNRMQQQLAEKNLYLGMPMQMMAQMGFDNRKDPLGYARASRAVSQVPLPVNGDFNGYQTGLRQALLDSQLHPEKYDSFGGAGSGQTPMAQPSGNMGGIPPFL